MYEEEHPDKLKREQTTSQNKYWQNNVLNSTRQLP